MTADPTFQLRDVSLSFGAQRALDGVTLSIPTGSSVALVGPSGAGKTSLLRILGGFANPTGGTVSFDGASFADLDARGLRAARSRIGFVHQEHALVPNLRVSQNVIAGKLGQRGALAGLRSMTWPSRLDVEHAHAILERLGISEKLFSRTDTLSGGERQRVAVARALFQSPRVLLADEPIAAVDPARSRSLLQLLRKLASEDGATLVVSLHDVALARELFPRLVGLRAGRVLFDSAPGDIDGAEYDALYAMAEN